MCQDVPSCATANGNTVHSPNAGKHTNPIKHWAFTLNNYTDEDVCQMCQIFTFIKAKYIFGKEICPKTGTPHLQGQFSLEKKKRMGWIKKNINDKMHLSPTRNLEASIAYCAKDGDVYTNIRRPRQLKFPEMNKWWQIEILEIIKEEPDDRKIHWYWSNQGAVGKTTFVKYLMHEHYGIAVPPKSADAANELSKYATRGDPIDLVVMNIPRDKLNYINYGSIESIKDGLIISGKYEGFCAALPCPHLFVFANEPPDVSKISSDRWVIVNIDELGAEPLAGVAQSAPQAGARVGGQRPPPSYEEALLL